MTPNLRESAKRLRVCTVHRAWECHCGNGCLVTTDSFDSSNTLCDHTDKLNPPSDCKIQTWVPLSAYDAQAEKIEKLETALKNIEAGARPVGEKHYVSANYTELRRMAKAALEELK